jgi:protein ImuB
MLWLALHLPLLSLEAFCATLPDSAGPRPPVALIDGHQLGAVNSAAAACGLRPGQKRATALALAPALLLGQADAKRDAAALQAVAHAALAFTPQVALEASDPAAATVVLEVQPSLRLFGGLARLLQRLDEALAPLGHRVQRAAAPTPLAAALLARWHPVDSARGLDAAALLHGAHHRDLAALTALLDTAPVWLLGPGREHWEALQGMGLHTLGDLRALPRGGLARRFGAGLLDDLDRAHGRRTDPRQPLLLPPAFDSTLELYSRADDTGQVLAGATLLLARLLVWAQARQVRLRAFTLSMQHEPRRYEAAPPATVLRIELAEATLDRSHLLLLLRERLGRCTLAAPTLALAMHCHEVAAGPAPNAELFPSRQNEAEGLARLLERLRARLGDGAVLRVLPLADHRPERAQCEVPALGAVQAGAAGVDPAACAPGATLLPLLRPGWLLPEPLPLPVAVHEQLPRYQGRPLRLLSGPERIESGWWDGAPTARDYYIAADHDGQLLWIWRNRLPDAQGDLQWFLQGRFG